MINNIIYDQYIWIDPGVRCVQTSCNDKDQIIQITTRSYRYNSKMNYACKKRERWYKNGICILYGIIFPVSQHLIQKI